VIRSSELTNALSEALTKAQAEFPVIPKTHTAKIPIKAGGEYSYRYADLADTVAAACPILTKNGISVTQFPDWDGEADILTTRVMHESGQWLEASMRLFLAAESPQAHGSAITYAKRYAYCSAVGIVADEDDDGASATHSDAPRYQSEGHYSGGSGSKMISEAQVKLVETLAKKLNYDEPGQAVLKFVAKHIPPAELTMAEARTLIDALKAQESGFRDDDEGPDSL
jgi:hypothetical protein